MQPEENVLLNAGGRALPVDGKSKWPKAGEDVVIQGIFLLLHLQVLLPFDLPRSCKIVPRVTAQ